MFDDCLTGLAVECFGVNENTHAVFVVILKLRIPLCCSVQVSLTKKCWLFQSELLDYMLVWLIGAMCAILA